MTKMKVKSIGVLSLAKIQGAITAAIGLIFGVLYGVFLIIFGAVMLSAGGNTGARRRRADSSAA